MIEVGQALPEATLYEYIEIESESCSIGPNPVDVTKAAAGKTVIIFALPGAFTPTCSAQHLPGYISKIDALRAAGADEIWCLSVNDAFVMHAWGKSAGSDGKVRMMADGSAQLAKALGLTLDLTARGMGLRSQRFAMIVRDGVVADLQIEAPGKFEVSAAEYMLARLD
jgi:glutaredoxin/glutathione-dependent peroxiredoxin